MSTRRLRRAVPRPVRRRLARAAGWGYLARRRLRQLAERGGRPPPPPRGRDPRVPADAPECVVATNEHGLYCVPLSSSHRPVAQAILQSRVWEADTLNFLRWCDPAGDVLHAGTFFGDFLPALAHTRDGGALVWAFEPGAENFRCTQITIEVNDLDNVVLVNRGLGAAGGRALLATGDRRGVPLGGGSKLLADPARAHWWENEQVELVAADDVIGEERAVAAIHLDVEGYERQALWRVRWA